MIVIKYILIGFACIAAYRLISNVCALVKANYYSKEYTLFLSNPEKDFIEHCEAVTQLFNAAGIKDSLIPFLQLTGYGNGFQGHTSLLKNMSNRREDVVGLMIRNFNLAKGTFKHRIFETFSPFFWINQILFLPRTIMDYIGIKADSVIVKVFQLLYWFITPLLIAFRDNIYQYIISFLG